MIFGHSTYLMDYGHGLGGHSLQYHLKECMLVIMHGLEEGPVQSCGRIQRGIFICLADLDMETMQFWVVFCFDLPFSALVIYFEYYRWCQYE